VNFKTIFIYSKDSSDRIRKGIKSIARSEITQEPDRPVDTGDVAYRILIPSKEVLDDPELADLVKDPWATTWTGPEGHFVGYPIRAGQLYNMIVCVSHESTLKFGAALGEDDWQIRADNSELTRRFEGWCPAVQKLCQLSVKVSIGSFATRTWLT
jgi:salicylate hydroxylase